MDEQTSECHVSPRLCAYVNANPLISETYLSP